jgi:hypothetical protein
LPGAFQTSDRQNLVDSAVSNPDFKSQFLGFGISRNLLPRIVCRIVRSREHWMSEISSGGPIFRAKPASREKTDQIALTFLSLSVRPPQHGFNC